MGKSNSFFNNLMIALNQAIDHEKNNLTLNNKKVVISDLPNYEKEKIRSLRIKLGLTQKIFALVMGVSRKTVEAWESGKNIPQGPALRLLKMFDEDPELIKKQKILVM